MVTISITGLNAAYADMPGKLDPIRPLVPDPGGPYSPSFDDSPIYEHDEYVTQQASDFIQGFSASKDKRPFCLVAGYVAAHPCTKAYPAYKTLYDKYMKMDLKIPCFKRDDYEKLPEHIKRLHQYYDNTEQIFSEEFHKHEMAWYFSRVTYVDQQMGHLLKTLKKSGLEDNTVVIFLSDHGDNMGYHGLWSKMNFYQEAEKIPFYIRVPGLQGNRVINEKVSIVDVLPTLADLSGCEITFPVDGHSLAPILKDQRQERSDAVIFSEYHGYCSPSDMYMAIKGDYKYCMYLREPDELYNLAEDPSEENNLIDNPALSDIRTELEREIRSRVNVEEFQEHICAYNAQRQTITEAILASPIIRQDTINYIEEFRAKLDEPWWDGGEDIRGSEKHIRGDVSLKEIKE